MPLSKRQELLQLARKHDALLICDDVYDFLRWPSRPNIEAKQTAATLPRIVDLDILNDVQGATSFGNCVSNGSFSKILGPGCRVGWAESTPRFIYGLTQAYETHSLHSLTSTNSSQRLNSLRWCSISNDVNDHQRVVRTRLSKSAY